MTSRVECVGVHIKYTQLTVGEGLSECGCILTILAGVSIFDRLMRSYSCFNGNR